MSNQQTSNEPAPILNFAELTKSIKNPRDKFLVAAIASMIQMTKLRGLSNT